MGFVKGGGEQWFIVGDTYILGCALRNTHVFPDLDKLCSDMANPRYNTNMGIYKEHCGLNNCVIAWGHDEYLYDVLQYNRQKGNITKKFPECADYIIRFHSLYPWHTYGEYREFESDYDTKYKHLVQLFNKYDLYTKENIQLDIEKIKPYYVNLIKKYFPSEKLIF